MDIGNNNQFGLRVLLATSDNDLSSGAFNSCAFLAKELMERGHYVVVVVPKSGDGETLLKENGVPYRVVESEDWIVSNDCTKEEKKKKIKRIKELNKKARNAIRQIIREEKIDIVHINTTYHYVSALAAIGTHAKVVWHIREFLEQDQNKHILLRKIAIRLINRSNAIICISKAIIEKYKNDLKDDKVHLVYNGIDEKKYFSSHAILDKKTINMLCVGAVWERKGQFELIEALGLHHSKYGDGANLRLKLVGTIDQGGRDVIKDICEKYGIHNIEILGKKSNPEKYYNEADAVFMSSFCEAFGRVTVEGMMSGCLVIGRNSGSTPEIIKNNKTGVLYDNPLELREIIQSVIDNKAYYKKVAKTGQETALRQYTAKKNCDEVIKIYKKVLESQ